MRPFNDSPEVPCGMCGTPTTMTGTQRCDRCWELETRIHANPKLARQVLRRLDPVLICEERGEQVLLRMEEERGGVLFSSSRLINPLWPQYARFDLLTMHYGEMLALVRQPAEVAGV